MRSEAPRTEAETAEGAAFPLPVKALASLLVAALLFWGIRAADQIVGVGWSAGAVAFMAITLCVIGLCYYWIMCSRTAIDATSIRQTWLWPKRVALADITQAKLIYVPYLRWLIAPRLIVRARGLGMFVFHAADDKVLRKFVNLSLGAIADTSPRQKIPVRESQVAGMPGGKCVADHNPEGAAEAVAAHPKRANKHYRPQPQPPKPVASHRREN